MRKNNRRLIHQSEIDAVWRLKGDGCSKYQIARIVGISHDTIDDIVVWGRIFGSVGYDPVARQEAIDRAEALIKAGVQHRDAARRVGVSYRDMMAAFQEKYRATKTSPDRASRRSECRTGMFSDGWWISNNERFVRGAIAAYPELESVYAQHEERRALAKSRSAKTHALVAEG